MKLRELIAPRRRKKPRPDGPRTIVPVSPSSEPAAKFDAARERLRAQIPPRSDQE
ncbi:MAG: hypothetical protein ACJ762_10620 [Solirubrobacteraceae bacterium]